MPISEIERRKAEKVLTAYCGERTNPSLRDLLQIVFRLEGNYAYVSERRPHWQDSSIVRDIANLLAVVDSEPIFYG